MAEVNKVIHFPFQRHINFSNYMRLKEGLKIPERKTNENGYNNNIIYIYLQID